MQVEALDSAMEVDSYGPSALADAVRLAKGKCIRLFVAGAVSHVGKTTACLGLLAALREAGLEASDLAYIKPATQCEAPDLLQRWCEKEGVEYVSGTHAPLVFYAGFTRSFLNGEQGTSAEWLQKISDKVDEMAKKRKVLVVDGVGFPGVGSIVGVDNADVAMAARAPVLLVCKSGVGAAIDSFSLNSAYFLSKGVPVLGAMFNFGELEGFNSWDKCLENIKLWFASKGGRRERNYGVVPMASSLDGLRERVLTQSREKLSQFAALNASHFAEHLDIPGIITDAALDRWCRDDPPPAAKRPRVQSTAAGSFSKVEVKTRESVAASAKAQGARGGG